MHDKIPHCWQPLRSFLPIQLVSSRMSFRACMLSHSVMSDSLVPQWTVAHQVPLSVGFSRQEYWSGAAISSSRGSSRPRGIEPRSPALAGGSFTTEPPGKPLLICDNLYCFVVHKMNVIFFVLDWSLLRLGLS